jgi:hypothetical protein
LTVTTNTNKAQHLGNGVTTAFPYSFRIFSASDLVVTRTDLETGVDSTLVLNTDYTVTGAGSYNGGHVVTPVAPADGTRLTILRSIPVTQGTDLRNQGSYFAETHEDVFDRLTMIDQQQQEQLDRSIVFPASDNVESHGDMPTAGSRANNLLGFDADGKPIAVAPASQSATALQIALAQANGGSLIGGVGQVVSSIAALRALLKTSASNKAFATGYYANGDGGGGPYYYDSSDTTSADNGGTIIVANDGGRWKLSHNGTVSMDQFGAKGDFVPSTGAGTDDRAAIQGALTWAASYAGGATLIAGIGKRYYLGTGYSDTTINAQLVVGSRTTTNAANNLTIETYGSEFYVGAAGFGISFANANSCKWLGLRIFGYTGGTLGSSRENDAPVLINRNCLDFTLQHHYITNSLGDCITISGAVDVASGGTGYTCRNIKILDGVLKSRYGNGTASVSGGTKSRNAISVIDAHGVLIRGNTIYGAIDLEPNISNQYIANVRITQNRFSTGHVTAQSSIGTAYWYDEPTALTGGSQLSNSVSLQGIAGAPLISGNVVESNDFELTTIVGSYVYRWDRIADNTFQAGLIQLAVDNVAGSMTNTQIARNISYGVVGANTSFILLNGQVANCLFADNVLYKSGAYYCIKVGVNSIGPAFDQQNVFVNNLAIGGSGSITGSTNANSLIAADSNVNGTRTITGNQTVNGTASCSTGSVSNNLAVGGNVAIVGSAVANRNIIFANNTAVATEFRNTNTGTGAGVAEFNAAAAQGTGFNLLDGYTSATGTPALQFFIRGDGTYGSRPNVYGATSDAKLKKDISLAGSQWDDVKALAAKVSKFRFKDDPDGVLMLGFIAQDVEAISPGLVDEHADVEWIDVLDEEGNVIAREKQLTGTTTKSVKYSLAYMKGFKALGEAQERIESLEAALAELKARMA